MSFVFGNKSNEKLASIKPQLANVVRRALELSTVDFTVLEGRRTQARQDELYAQGRTKPGKIVTGTRNSKHITGDAVDIAPYPIDWEDTKRFDAMAKAMFAAAAELGVAIRWGADWDKDGNFREKGEYDSPHFELA